jgi:hypothetical protein
MILQTSPQIHRTACGAWLHNRIVPNLVKRNKYILKFSQSGNTNLWSQKRHVPIMHRREPPENTVIHLHQRQPQPLPTTPPPCAA